ncbi:AAA family ATPase [Candidatus Pacearchaeota archaeon]|nr:AAA family ATPase [Candidatus Pacearchaeota archaeon]
MVYIKKLVMHGFKSFVRKTEIPFTPGINVILGPNGSGKSNISDALCFVLGRLSIKSMRAAKAKNLIFLGTKKVSKAKKASVELVFDNSDSTFSIDDKEVSIKRIVKRNGQSTYKINNKTKTRQEIIALLAQAGIDPNGFNIILQGEIQNFVNMHNEERREIIEEVSGISIYESRKAKSLKELKKTDERLKEVLAVLRERTSYLNNLEKERKQALKFKKLEKDVKKYKASIINADLNKKKKEIQKINNDIEKKTKEIGKVKKQINELETQIRNYELKIDSINNTIQKSTGLEQEKLNQEIANLRADLAGLNVKSENFGRKLNEIDNKKQELQDSIKEDEEELKELEKTTSSASSKSKKKKDIDAKKQKLEELEKQRKKFYTMKAELKAVKERLQDKQSVLQGYETESDYLVKQVENLVKELYDKKTNTKIISDIKVSLQNKKDKIKELDKNQNSLYKKLHTNQHEIKKKNNLVKDIKDMDVCPLCKNKITKEHIKEIKDKAQPQIKQLKKQIESAEDKLADIQKQKSKLSQEIDSLTEELSKRESDLVKISNINNKKDQIKKLHENTEGIKEEIKELKKKKSSLEKNFDENSNIEKRYEEARIEVQEISLRNKENIDSEISFKKREFERNKIELKQLKRDEEDLKEDLASIKSRISEKEKRLNNKKKQDEELNKKFQKMIADRDALQLKIRKGDSDLSLKQNIVYNLEQDMNDYKISKARVKAELDGLETEMKEFEGVEIIKSTKESLLHKLHRTQDTLNKIGSVNLKSLEVYDEIKKEYDSINDKVEVLKGEKEDILKVIHEIDIKKKKTFLNTLKDLNELFSRNFSQLSSKGQVFLELENKKEPFEAGVNIIVKTGHGKYFDVTSLSGGEQTLVALSLIFAIQELKPYCFYILDEIDAALDKRNSARLARLLNKYMKKGQYIVISHNDEVISKATNLYGVSMHDGVSKIISLKL